MKNNSYFLVLFVLIVSSHFAQGQLNRYPSLNVVKTTNDTIYYESTIDKIWDPFSTEMQNNPILVANKFLKDISDTSELYNKNYHLVYKKHRLSEVGLLIIKDDKLRIIYALETKANNIHGTGVAFNVNSGNPVVMSMFKYGVLDGATIIFDRENQAERVYSFKKGKVKRLIFDFSNIEIYNKRTSFNPFDFKKSKIKNGSVSNG